MISERSYNLFYYVINFYSLMGCIPFEWDPIKREFLRSSRCRRILRYHTATVGFYIVLTGGACVWYRIKGEVETFNLMYGSVCQMLIIFQIFIWFVFLEDDTFIFTNYLFQLLQKLHRDFMPHIDLERDKLTMAIEFGAFWLLLNYSFFLMVSIAGIFLYPHSAFMFGHAIPESYPFIVKFPLCYLYPTYTLSLLFINCYIIVLTCYAYGAFFVPFVVLELRVDRKKSYRSIPELRQPSTLMLTYRTAQVFQQQVNRLMGYFLVPTQSLVSQLSVLSTFMIIRYGPKMKLTSSIIIMGWSSGAAGFWILILWMGGYLHFFGVKIISSWKYHDWGSKPDKKMMSKFRKSCMPLMIKFQKAYIIKRLTVLKFIRSLSRGILRVLLTL